MTNDYYDDRTDLSRLWTAGFLNERFPQPVSPLGWTLIRSYFEELALRAPLRYLGIVWPAERPLTRLYGGHPYVDAEAFWAIYKLFPDFALPEDATRFFPGGEVSLRRTIPHPTGLWDPRVWLHVGRSILADPANWSPWHNWRAWRSFEASFPARLLPLEARAASVTQAGEVMAVLDDVRRLMAGLLRVHRWSLTHADLTYSLLRRLLRSTLDAASTEYLSARLVAGVPNYSVELNGSLHELEDLRRAHDPRFAAAFQVFLRQHGHRSFSLDIYWPPFGAAPNQAIDLLGDLPVGPKAGADWRSAAEEVECALHGVAARPRLMAFRRLLSLTRSYMGLREDQRYRWQQALAVARRLALGIARSWAANGELDEPDQVFFITLDELERRAHGLASLPDRRRICGRAERFAELTASWRRDPARHYPAFLRGDTPLAAEAQAPAGPSVVFRGRAASPGLARGPVRRVCAPDGLSAVAPGDVLVARTTDPGWTPVFNRIAALVTETGGLLSHGVVVAREYGVPAVVAVEAIYDSISDDQWIEVNGGTGLVSVLNRHS